MSESCRYLFFQEKINHFKFQNQEIFYEFNSKGPKGVVLLLHGNTQDSSSLKPMSVAFQKSGYSTLLIDMVGSGKTLNKFSLKKRIPSSIPIQLQVEAIKKIIDHLGIENLHIVGHSYGGGVGLKLSTVLKERVLSLSLLSTLIQKLDNFYLDPFNDVRYFWADLYDFCIQCRAWDSLFGFVKDPMIEFFMYYHLREYYKKKFPDDSTTISRHIDATMALTRGIGSFNAIKLISRVHTNTQVIILNASGDFLSPEKLNKLLFSKSQFTGHKPVLKTVDHSDHLFALKEPITTTKEILSVLEAQ